VPKAMEGETVQACPLDARPPHPTGESTAPSSQGERPRQTCLRRPAKRGRGLKPSRAFKSRRLWSHQRKRRPSHKGQDGVSVS
jgi:hypothetical protein